MVFVCGYPVSIFSLRICPFTISSDVEISSSHRATRCDTLVHCNPLQFVWCLCERTSASSQHRQQSHTLYFTLTMMANTLGLWATLQCCGKWQYYPMINTAHGPRTTFFAKFFRFFFCVTSDHHFIHSQVIRNILSQNGCVFDDVRTHWHRMRSFVY